METTPSPQTGMQTILGPNNPFYLKPLSQTHFLFSV